jgi:hypothetical protein
MQQTKSKTGEKSTRPRKSLYCIYLFRQQDNEQKDLPIVGRLFIQNGLGASEQAFSPGSRLAQSTRPKHPFNGENLQCTTSLDCGSFASKRKATFSGLSACRVHNANRFAWQAIGP